VRSSRLPSGNGSSIRRVRDRAVRRRELQHIILEVGERFALTEVFVIGSSAILAVLPDPPEGVLTTTRDVDIILPNDEDERLADQISYVIGEASPFDIEYGYHAQGVSLKTPTYAPHGWQARTIDISVGKIVAHCMEPHDVVLSKLGAGREKDLEFARAAAVLGLIEQSVLLSRLRLVPATAEHSHLIAERIAALFK
jgi:hypothetical protein